MEMKCAWSAVGIQLSGGSVMSGRRGEDAGMLNETGRMGGDRGRGPGVGTCARLDEVLFLRDLSDVRSLGGGEGARKTSGVEMTRGTKMTEP